MLPELGSTFSVDSALTPASMKVLGCISSYCPIALSAVARIIDPAGNYHFYSWWVDGVNIVVWGVLEETFEDEIGDEDVAYLTDVTPQDFWGLPQDKRF